MDTNFDNTSKTETQEELLARFNATYKTTPKFHDAVKAGLQLVGLVAGSEIEELVTNMVMSTFVTGVEFAVNEINVRFGTNYELESKK